MKAPAPPSHEALCAWLRAANDVARSALAAGHHPFGAVLIGPDERTVLMSQGNVDTVNHAEAVLARRAAAAFDAPTLWASTLVTTVEPCCMCAGTQYWAHIGRLVYGLSEHALGRMTGNHTENPTMDLPCRDVFSRGQKPIVVIGPVEAMADEIAALHRDFWRTR